jgi:glyoxylase-like metal-dependent hydrolase (beta-lactamase superfamily II)
LEHPAGGWPLRADLPHARYLFGRDELADWMAQRQAGTIPALHGAAIEDSVIPILDAGLADLVDGGHELAANLTLTPLPGHTSGQMGVMLEQRAGGAIFCADAIHSPIQILQPDVSTVDTDPAAAIISRRTVLEEACESRRTVIPAHFRGQRRAQVRRVGNAFEPIFPPDPA